MADAARILEALRKYHGAKPRNWHTRQDAFRVLISAVLSQRTRDESTDMAAKALFAKYRTVESLAAAPAKSIEKAIRSVGFYRTKAPRVKAIAEIISEKYNGVVPESMEELLALPGVGRKTAGCALVYGHGVPAVPVDVHVHRISNRLGIIDTKNPRQTEESLMRLVPKKQWLLLNQLFVVHGQTICRPVTPMCGACPVDKYCGYRRSSYRRREYD